MPNTKSAKKRLRQNLIRRDRRRSGRSALRTMIKKVLQAVKDGDLTRAESTFKSTARALDRAGARRLVHANQASRLKSRLSARIKRAKQATAA